MADFKVETLQGSHSWTHAQGGENIDYTINVSGGDAMQGEAVTITRKPESKAPQVGDVLENYELLPKKGQHPRKLKRMPQAYGAGNRSGGGRQDDPKTIARITRSHAQKMALEHAKVLHFSGKLPEGYGVESLKPIIDWFENDVLAKAAEA